MSYPTAWLLKHKIMQVMLLREESRQLTGRVEIDDSYLGGEECRKSNSPLRTSRGLRD